MEIYKKDVFKIIVLMDTFNKKFRLISNYSPMALFSVAGVPHKEYALQFLSVGGITETILFYCKDPLMIEKFMKESGGPWKYVMDIQIKSSDSCQSVGDVMREIDAASLIKGVFIHFGINTVTNIHLAPLLEHHKETVKKNKGAAMTLVLKELYPEHSLLKSEKSFFLAADNETKKLLVHEKYKQTTKKRTVSLPTKHLLSNAEVIMHHNLVDSNNAVCSPSVLPLFGDNLDFKKLKGFFRGLFIRVDMSADSLYFTLLKANQYAAFLTNWNTYNTDCFGMLYHYEYPLTLLSGAYKHCHYTAGWRALINETADVNRSCRLCGDSILGEKCKNSLFSNFSINQKCSIEEDCINEGGAAIAQKLTVQPEAELNDSILEKFDSKEESTSESGTECENECVGSEEDEFLGLDKEYNDGLSCFSSDVREDFSTRSSPFPDDTNIFLGGLIDKFTRCFEDNVNCDMNFDYLLQKINASRYAYNIQVHELNFYLMRALLSLPQLTRIYNVPPVLREVIKFYRPILKNYIRYKSAVMDCLRAVEEAGMQYEWLKAICSHVFQILYEEDIVDKESLLEFYDYLLETDNRLLQYHAVTLFFEWLQKTQEESNE